jgi:hypothetical protein
MRSRPGMTIKKRRPELDGVLIQCRGLVLSI